MATDTQGKILTVTGPIEPGDLGKTLIHEHLFFDLSCYFRPPEDERGKCLADEPLQLSNLGWVRQNIMSSRPNLVMDDAGVVEAEVGKFQNLGGSALVDQTIRGIAPNPQGLARVSARTGVRIVAGNGYYIHPSHPPDMDDKTIEDIRAEIIRNVTEGIDGSGIRSGLIGEIGACWPLHPNEEKCIRASAQAHRETGAPISIHPGHSVDSPPTILDILVAEGVDPSRVMMSHIENRNRDEIDLYRRLADRGCNLSFDSFGRDIYFAYAGRHHPSDDIRVNVISELVQQGYVGQIYVAQDCSFKSDLATYGGYGYGHVLENIVPRLKSRDVSDDDLDKILVENPRRFLTMQ